MRKKKSSGIGFFFTLVIVVVILGLLMRNESKKEQEYNEIVGSDLTVAEKAEKLRKLGFKNKTYNSAESAEVFQLLADGEYVQARETNKKYGNRIREERFADYIENELTGADEKLAAYHDLLDLTGADRYHSSSEWVPHEHEGVIGFGSASMLGFSKEEDLRANCGSSPKAGKLLILCKVNDAAVGVNLEAMGSIGEEAWPKSLSEIDYILEINYLSPVFSQKVYDMADTQLVVSTADYNIRLLNASGGNAIYEKTLCGKLPDSTWVGKGAYNEKTYSPGWEELSESINKAFQAAGLEWRAPKE